MGMIGGGQLARMSQQAAIALDIELVVLCADMTQGAGPVVPGAIHGSPDDPNDVRSLAEKSDVVTLDHELVDLELLQQIIDAGTPVRPGPQSLGAAVDKGVLRERLRGLDVEFADHVVVGPGEQLPGLPDWPAGAVVKAARGGYDGRGVWFPDDLSQLTSLVSEITASGVTAIVEERLPDLFEVAVMVVRRPGGEAIVYDPVRTYQRDGICVGLQTPAGIDMALEADVKALGLSIAAHLDVIGICAVEMFIHQGRPLVSEIAQRPHNSGHHTIEASATSQFENHLRAVLDLPLGDPSLVVPAVGMANILGGPGSTAPSGALADAMALDPGAKVHLYGKSPRPGRKLGHVTVIDYDPTTALRRATTVANVLGGTAQIGAAK